MQLGHLATIKADKVLPGILHNPAEILCICRTENRRTCGQCYILCTLLQAVAGCGFQ